MAAEIPSGSSLMMISAANKSATVPRKAPRKKPTGVLTRDKRRLLPTAPAMTLVAPADDDGDEGRRHELLAHEGHDGCRWREQRPGQSRERRAERESHHVDAARVDPERSRHRRILHGRPRLEADVRAVVDPPKGGDEQRGDQEHGNPVVRKRILAERDIARGDLDRRHEGAKEQQEALRQDKAHAPGDDQRPQFPAVEAPDDRRFEHGAENSNRDKSDDRRQPERRSPAVGRRGGIRSHHHQFAMREVDDVHHAEDDDQPERAQQQERRVGAELIDDARDDPDHVHVKIRWFRKDGGPKGAAVRVEPL